MSAHNTNSSPWYGASMMVLSLHLSFPIGRPLRNTMNGTEETILFNVGFYWLMPKDFLINNRYVFVSLEIMFHSIQSIE